MSTCPHPARRTAARRPRHDAAAEHAVELADPGRPPLDPGSSGLGDRTGDPGSGDGDGSGTARARRGRRRVLDRAPRLALTATADPLDAGPPALGAAVEGLGARHGSRLERPADTAVPRSVPAVIGVLAVLVVGSSSLVVLDAASGRAAWLLRQGDAARHPLPQPLHATGSAAVVELRCVLDVLLGRALATAPASRPRSSASRADR